LVSGLPSTNSTSSPLFFRAKARVLPTIPAPTMIKSACILKSYPVLCAPCVGGVSACSSLEHGNCASFKGYVQRHARPAPWLDEQTSVWPEAVNQGPVSLSCGLQQAVVC